MDWCVSPGELSLPSDPAGHGDGERQTRGQAGGDVLLTSAVLEPDLEIGLQQKGVQLQSDLIKLIDGSAECKALM